MKIEKKIAESRINLSSIAKKTLATSLGIAASVTYIACDGGDVSTDPISDTKTNDPSKESSDSEDFSSSSKYLDIPQSHEAISSEVLEALSSASQPASSVTQPTSNSTERISSAVQTTNSSANASSAAQPISSSTQGISSATQPASSTTTIATSSAEAKSSAVQQQSSAAQPTSSSATTPASSAVQPASSSYDPWGTAINPCDGLPAGSTVETDFQVIICPDSSNSSWSSHGFSMVTTFERDDIEV